MKFGALFSDYARMAVVLAFLVLVFSLSTDHFFTLTSLRSMANQIPAAVLIATA